MSLYEQLKDDLGYLQMGAASERFAPLAEDAQTEGWSHVEYLARVVGEQAAATRDRRLTARLRYARFPYRRSIEDFDFEFQPSVDPKLVADLATLRFTQAGNGVLILGPVGVGKTHLASAFGHIAIRRRLSVHAARADKLFTRLRAARLDNTLEAELRKLTRVDVLILDDFALKPLDATETNDFYELVVERHRKASTIVTSNREPGEWLTMMSDALLAQSAVDRLTSGAHTLIIEGPSYRQRGTDRRGAIDSGSEVR